jgi:hypothetical protein
LILAFSFREKKRLGFTNRQSATVPVASASGKKKWGAAAPLKKRKLNNLINLFNQKDTRLTATTN